MALNTFCLSIK